ncbi:aspartate aminotransferase family protein [Pollutimonas nitritireducens]|uniref:Aspartate aminotransferase family protein n=1 Tax=Pollutimonas nitritireducens TaxID=2045209 RepID=A0A2N4UC98_9BURK|nr:aspartate aminotransferase family protein [Pollutimonas nitritireducens]PLC52642.1 aspartate aminotransferase family protein [Pollutimonas nitritireducens]
MTYILHRQLGQSMPVAVRGSGVWLEDGEGKRYLDAVSGGAAVSCLGHGHPRIASAIANQLDYLAYAHGSFFTSQPAEQLATALLKDAPPSLSRVVFSSGGSESTECALKLVRQTWVERGKPEKNRIIARRQSYHGATVGALSVSGNVGRRVTYAPMLFEVHFIDPCYSYRLKHPGETDLEYGMRAANELERAILELGPENVAAFIAEPIVGATLGCAPPAPGYLKRIREICNQYEVLLILDEIMCGAGRTGVFYACAEDEVTPDILTIAKGLGGGYQSIGATLVAEDIVRTLENGSATLLHGFTYMGHPVACAAALAVQEVIVEEGLLNNVRERGRQLIIGLNENLKNHHNVGDVRGRGLFVGVELVADRNLKTPFSPERKLYARVKQAALDCALMVYPGGGTVDGVNGDHVLFAPAYNVTADEIDEIVSRFTVALDKALIQ